MKIKPFPLPACLLALLLIPMLCVPALAEETAVYQRDNFDIALGADGNATIVRFYDDPGQALTNDKLEIIVPGVLKTAWGEHPVTRIAAGAFTPAVQLSEKAKALVPFSIKPERLVLPEGLVEIAAEAFKGREAMVEIQLPASLTSIGDGAFSGCAGLARVSLPEGVTSLADRVFEGCKGLVEVILPPGLETIGARAFRGCKSLPAITLPEGLQSIGTEAFSNCEKLAGLTLPASLSFIAEDAFRGSGRVSFVLDQPDSLAADYADRHQIAVSRPEGSAQASGWMDEAAPDSESESAESQGQAATGADETAENADETPSTADEAAASQDTAQPAPENPDDAAPSPDTAQPATESPDEAAQADSAASQYQTLRLGAEGQAVLAARQRLYELGYFLTQPTQTEFTAGFIAYVKTFEKANALKEDGILSPEDQALLFSPEAKPKP